MKFFIAELPEQQGLEKGESFLEMLLPPSTLAMLQLKRAGERDLVAKLPHEQRADPVSGQWAVGRTGLTLL